MSNAFDYIDCIHEELKNIESKLHDTTTRWITPHANNTSVLKKLRQLSTAVTDLRIYIDNHLTK